MVRHLLIVLALFSISDTYGQWDLISNSGFEDWSNDTLYEKPSDWITSNDYEFFGTPTVMRSTDAQDGNFSARIGAVDVGWDTLGGYVYHGSMGPTGPDGGIPYSTNFEAVSVHFKCDLDPNDTLFMLMIRYNAATMVQFLAMPVAYGTYTNWTQQILFAGSIVQDELFIGFVMNNPITGQNPSPDSWAMVDNVVMLEGGVPVSALPNPSFENWDAFTTELPDNWYTLNTILAPYGIENSIKTTDAHTGNYAIELSTILASPDSIGGIVSLGPIDLFAPIPFLNSPYSGSPLSISGAYKYAPSNGDQGALLLEFYESGASVGIHYELFSAQANYTTFIAPLTITGTPDSVLLYAYSGDNPGSVLLLDDIQFTGSVGLLSQDLIDFALYPNPASSIVRIGLPENDEFDIRIISVDGKEVKGVSEVSGNQTVDVSDIQHGIYTVVVSNGTIHRSERLVIE